MSDRTFIHCSEQIDTDNNLTVHPQPPADGSTLIWWHNTGRNALSYLEINLPLQTVQKCYYAKWNLWWNCYNHYRMIYRRLINSFRGISYMFKAKYEIHNGLSARCPPLTSCSPTQFNARFNLMWEHLLGFNDSNSSLPGSNNIVKYNGKSDV